MKKLTIGLALLFSTAPYFANAYGSCSFQVPKYPNKLVFELQGLQLESNLGAHDKFSSGPDTDFIGFDLSLDSHNRNERDWAYRAGVGFTFPCTGNDAFLEYLHYDNDGKTHFEESNELVEINLPAILTSTDSFNGFFVESGTHTLPVLFNFSSALPAATEISSDIKANIFDVNVGQNICVKNFKMRLFAGLRWGELEHTTHVSTHISGFLHDVSDEVIVPVDMTGDGTDIRDFIVTAFADFDDIDINAILREKDKFTGVGPELGLDINYCIGHSNFSIIGSFSGALIVGDRDHYFDLTSEGSTSTSTNFTVIPDDFPNPIDEIRTVEFLSFNSEIHRTDQETAQLVPAVDLKLALGYSFCGCKTRVSIEAGYQYSKYWHAFNPSSSFDSSSFERRTHDDDHLSFEGPYIGVNIAL